jgi:Phytanoyl-CoA dioxygenase (PhyH)
MPTEAAIRVPGRGRMARLLARLPIYLADMRAHPGWTLMFVFGRLLPARRLAAALARWRSDRGAATAAGGVEADPGTLTAASPAAAVAALRRDGICAGLQLPEATVAEIRAFADSHPCHAGMDRRMPFLPAEHGQAERRYGRKILVGHFLDTVLDCPAVADLVQSRWLQAVAAGYLGAPPKNIVTRLWWSFPTSDPSPAELSLASQDGFHFDLDDWRQIKFFFYLTDVGLRTGPHIYVRGSHARRPLSHQLTLFVGKPEAEILATYGLGSLMTVIGSAGTGFAEDAFGYHTGTMVRHGRRLLLEISFGISDLLRRRRFGEVAS